MARAENKNAGLLAKHEDVVVIGLGLTGYSVVRYLAALGKNIQVLDTRKVAPFSEQLRQAYPDIPIYQGALDEDIPARILRNAKFLVVSPGVSIRHPELAAARARGADLVGDIELFSENNSQPVAAITGSNGKSTVTVLVGEILESAGKDPLVGGNIGLPVLDAVTESTAYKSVVLELSSFQLETTYSLASHVAAILNVSADHLDRYTDIEDYLQAKLRILNGADTVILCRDDTRVMTAARGRLDEETATIGFGLGEPERNEDYGIKLVDGQECLLRGSEVLISADDCRMQGRHNLLNIMAAWAIASVLGVSDENIASVARSFGGLPHRVELVGTRDGVRWINDSKATNPGATEAALKGLDAPVILIAGGQAKGASFDALSDTVNAHARTVILLGEDAGLVEDALAGSVPVVRVPDLAAAVEHAAGIADEGDVVLLSPACASFDMFGGYADRGEKFRDLVLQLEGGMN